MISIIANINRWHLSHPHYVPGSAISMYVSRLHEPRASSSTTNPLCSQVCKAPLHGFRFDLSPEPGIPNTRRSSTRAQENTSFLEPDPKPLRLMPTTSAPGILRGPSPSTHQLQHAPNLFQELLPSKLVTYVRRGVPSLPLQRQQERSSLQSSTFTNLRRRRDRTRSRP